MAGIVQKIQETFQSGDHKEEKQHKAEAELYKEENQHRAEAQHHSGDGQHKEGGEHKESIVDKVKDKISGGEKEEKKHGGD